MSMSGGNLYQLRSRHNRSNGSEWYINGPYDMWGYVIKQLEDNDVEKGGYLYLIRGTGSRRETPW